MARRDEDEDDEDASSRSSGMKTVFIVFGIVGGLFALAMLSCVGLIGLGIYQMRTAMTGMIRTTTISTQFVDHLKGNRNEQAYALMSNAYRAKVSREQFEGEVRKHPLLAQHQVATFRQSNLPDGQSKPATASFIMTLSETVTVTPEAMDEDDDDFRPGAVQKSVPKVPDKRKTPAPAPKKTLDLSLSLIEENGNWVIDSWSVIKE
jgi:hypothetical protein